MDREISRCFKIGTSLILLAVIIVYNVCYIAGGGDTTKYNNESNSGGFGLVYTMDNGIGFGWSLG